LIIQYTDKYTKKDWIMLFNLIFLIEITWF